MRDESLRWLGGLEEVGRSESVRDLDSWKLVVIEVLSVPGVHAMFLTYITSILTMVFQNVPLLQTKTGRVPRG